MKGPSASNRWPNPRNRQERIQQGMPENRQATPAEVVALRVLPPAAFPLENRRRCVGPTQVAGITWLLRTIRPPRASAGRTGFRGQPVAAGLRRTAQLAAQKLAHEPPGQTLQATALVHEAYLRLVGHCEEPGLLWNRG